MKSNAMNPTEPHLLVVKEKISISNWEEEEILTVAYKSSNCLLQCQVPPPSRGTDNDKQKNPLKKDDLPKKEPNKKAPPTSPPVERR